MNEPPMKPERVADDVARRLLERATFLEEDGPTLVQLRQAATDAGISADAFDAAVAEWRAESPRQSPTQSPRQLRSSTLRRWTELALRNAAGLAAGWSAVAALAVGQRLLDAPWLVHKLTDPIGLAIGAFVAARLRARPAAIVLSGLAVAQGAEFLMDLFSGAPSVRGVGAHMALMIAGICGVAVGRVAWGRRNDSSGSGEGVGSDLPIAPPDDSSASRVAEQEKPDADRRFMETLRLHQRSYVTRLQVG